MSGCLATRNDVFRKISFSDSNATTNFFGELREDRLAYVLVTPKRAERVPKRILFARRRYVAALRAATAPVRSGTAAARPH